MMLLGARPTPSRRRCDSSVWAKPLPRTSPARSQVPTKMSASLSTIRPQWTNARDYLRRMVNFSSRRRSNADGFPLPARHVSGQIDAEAARLPPPQRRVSAATVEQLLVRSLLDDAAAVEHDEAV